MSQQPQDQNPPMAAEKRAGYLPPKGPAGGAPTRGQDVDTSVPVTPPPINPAAGPEREGKRVTRAGMVWASVATGLVVLVLLIIFILQNQDYVQVRFLGLEGAVPLGVSLFIAAVAGGVLVAIAGAARIIQLRAAAHRRRTTGVAPPSTPPPPSTAPQAG